MQFTALVHLYKPHVQGRVGHFNNKNSKSNKKKALAVQQGYKTPCLEGWGKEKKAKQGFCRKVSL